MPPFKIGGIFLSTKLKFYDKLKTMLPSSSGPGHRPLTAETPVQLRLGAQ